jgi:hypothetical protein
MIAATIKDINLLAGTLMTRAISFILKTGWL